MWGGGAAAEKVFRLHSIRPDWICPKTENNVWIKYIYIWIWWIFNTYILPHPIQETRRPSIIRSFPAQRGFAYIVCFKEEHKQQQEPKRSHRPSTCPYPDRASAAVRFAAAVLNHIQTQIVSPQSPSLPPPHMTTSHQTTTTAKPTVWDSQ